MKKLIKIELTEKEVKTLREAKEILNSLSETNEYYVEYWKQYDNIIRLNPCGNRSARGLYFDLQFRTASQMWSKEEREQKKQEVK